MPRRTPDDILIAITVANRKPRCRRPPSAPTLWYRNHLDLGLQARGGAGDQAEHSSDGGYRGQADHVTFGTHILVAGFGADGTAPRWLFTENENQHAEALRNGTPGRPMSRMLFHDYLIHDRSDAVNPAGSEPKVRRPLSPGGSRQEASDHPRSGWRRSDRVPAPGWEGFRPSIPGPVREADEFYADRLPPHMTPESGMFVRQAHAGSCEQTVLSLPSFAMGSRGIRNSPRRPRPGPAAQCGLAPPVTTAT